MIDYRITQIADPTAAQLAGFKAFIAANGAETDAFLSGLLKRAMMDVQKWEDRTLLAGTATIVATGREDDPAEPVLLYGTPEVDSIAVTDAAGDALAFSLVGRLVLPSYRAASLTITYTTAPVDADLADLMPKVYRYGAALYDGEGSPALAKILQER